MGNLRVRVSRIGTTVKVTPRLGVRFRVIVRLTNTLVLTTVMVKLI